MPEKSSQSSFDLSHSGFYGFGRDTAFVHTSEQRDIHSAITFLRKMEERCLSSCGSPFYEFQESSGRLCPWRVTCIAGNHGWSALKATPLTLFSSTGSLLNRPRLSFISAALGRNAFEMRLACDTPVALIECDANGVVVMSGHSEADCWILDEFESTHSEINRQSPDWSIHASGEAGQRFLLLKEMNSFSVQVRKDYEYIQDIGIQLIGPAFSTWEKSAFRDNPTARSAEVAVVNWIFGPT